MKNRKRGFSLVELLIVLAVIAALIATITPVALNAIKKAKATQVAQNLKTLASAIENLLYVEGADELANASFSKLGRDISSDYQLVVVDLGTGEFKAWATYKKDDVDDGLVGDIISNATKTTSDISYTIGSGETLYTIDSTGIATKTTGEVKAVPANSIYYSFTFAVY
ncbi:hypothetical protein RM69_03735 [Mesotoga sp. SC_NapDC3]|nr:hypothetical protein RM69_03735 [Mesotoga sp. SC_NapDC3]